MGNCRCCSCISVNGNVLIVNFLYENWICFRKSRKWLRISIADIIKKYISLGFEVLLSENYGRHIGIDDDEYLKLGVKISKDDKKS